MSRRSKFDPVLKVELVEKYLRNEIGIKEATRLAGLSETNTKSFRQWVSIYRNEGPAGLLDQKRNKHYSREVKLRAVHDYLNGKGSLMDISSQYGLRSKKQLQDWLKQYNTHGEIKCRGSGGGSYMRKARQTTSEERLAIVQDCLANNKNYGAMALKHNCSYQQVRNWVKRYEEMGSTGLEDRRGRRAGSQPARTPEEELRDKIVELERKNRDLQMENDLLKKVRELEMKDRYL
jgi:transposase-like protein